MKRREFLTKLSAGVSAVPILGVLFSTGRSTTPPSADIPTESINLSSAFNSSDLTRRTRYWESNHAVRSKLIYIHRTPTVEYAVEEEHKLTDDLIKEFGQFEIYPTKLLPNIKIGSSVSESFMRKLHKQKVSSDFLFSHLDSTASILAVGLLQRQNMLCLSLMLADTLNQYGMLVPRRQSPTLSTVHREFNRINFSKTPFKLVKEHLTNLKNKYGVTYDRVTMNTDAALIFTSKEDISNAATLIRKELGLVVEIDDSYFIQRTNEGSRIEVPYLNRNKILFSSIKNDGNKDVLHFGTTVCTEQVVSNLFNNSIIPTSSNAGTAAYYTINESFNPPAITAWAVNRGFPVLKDETAFASITLV